MLNLFLLFLLQRYLIKIFDKRNHDINILAVQKQRKVNFFIARILLQKTLFFVLRKSVFVEENSFRGQPYIFLQRFTNVNSEKNLSSLKLFYNQWYYGIDDQATSKVYTVCMLFTLDSFLP